MSIGVIGGSRANGVAECDSHSRNASAEHEARPRGGGRGSCTQKSAGGNRIGELVPKGPADRGMLHRHQLRSSSFARLPLASQSQEAFNRPIKYSNIYIYGVPVTAYGVGVE
jgi:hypothetical protein